MVRLGVRSWGVVAEPARLSAVGRWIYEFRFMQLSRYDLHWEGSTLSLALRERKRKKGTSQTQTAKKVATSIKLSGSSALDRGEVSQAGR